MIKPHNLSSALKKHLSLWPVTLEPVAEERNAEKVTDQEELQELIVTAYTENSVALKVIQALQTGAQRLKQFPLSECELWDNWVYYRNRLFVPGNDKLCLKILQLCHDTLLAGHSGTAKLLKIIVWTYWWSDWTKHVSQYLWNCPECYRAKPFRLHYQGALKSLSVPDRRWVDISMNFVEGLPSSLNKNSILCTTMIVIVNRLFKQAHAIPWSNTTAKDTAMAFYYRIFPQHGLPFTIISDRGTQFVSYFWQALCETLGIKTLLFTAFHPQTDGQTERTNVIIEMYLHMYVNYMQNDWAWWCPSTEFTYNNHISEATKCTSFFVNSEQHSRMVSRPCIERIIWVWVD